jgi:DNA-binding transcriptional ArsR family regulator
MIKKMPHQELIENCESTARVLKALAHPNRLQLLCHLSEDSKTVGELEELCEISQSAVSQFLNRMKIEGLVDSTKEGQYVYYRIADKRISKLIQSLQKIFCHADKTSEGSI